MRHEQLIRAVKDKYDRAGGKAGWRQLTRMLNNDGIEVSALTVRHLGGESTQSRW